MQTLVRRLFTLFLAALLPLTQAQALAAPARPVGGELSQGYVALTFDDGPCDQVTGAILDALESRNVYATFFLCGCCVDALPEALPAYRAGGHELGIHSYSHDYMQRWDYPACTAELGRSVEAILPADLPPTLFRAPGGLYSDTLRRAAGDLGLSMIGWSVDPRDWEGGTAETIARHVLDCARDGDIILLHELHMATAQALPAIIDGLRARGLEPVTVSQLAMLRGTVLEPGEEYRRLP